jgi:hypothetical protein
MFNKILIADRGDKARGAGLAAKPNGVARAARGRDLDPIEVHHV